MSWSRSATVVTFFTRFGPFFTRFLGPAGTDFVVVATFTVVVGAAPGALGAFALPFLGL
jgi:hypothetical protein